MKQGWEIKKLGEVFDLQMGKTPSRDNGDYWGGDNVWVAISDLQDKYIGESKEHITDKALTETKIKKVKAGTTIMSFKLSVGRAAITTQDLYTNEAIMAFNLNEGYDLIADYIYYYLKGYKWQGANKAVMGLTLNKASISQNHIAIPPRKEQERIVEELDCLSGIIERKREQLRELDALAQSIFYQMFGDPITNEKGWEVKTIGDVCKLKSGDSSANNTSEGLLPYIKVGDMNMSENIPYITTSSTLVNREENIKGIFPIGTTIFPKRGGAIFTNKKRLTTVEICCDLNTMGVIPMQQVLPLYIFHFFIQIDFGELCNGAAIPQINNIDIAPLKICVPPLALQQEFADKIEAIEKQKELIKESISEVEDLFNSRMSYYFN